MTHQEWEFHLSTAIAGGTFVYQPDLIYHYRNHDHPDRISQSVHKKQLRWEIQINACLKLIKAYHEEPIYRPTKAKIRKRLCKYEAKFFRLKQDDMVKKSRSIRRQIDPPWRMLLSDIPYISNKYF